MPVVTNAFRLSLAFALACTLSACWHSEKPVMTAAESDQPIASGSYLYRDSNGEEARVGLLKIPGGGYVYFMKHEGAMPLLVKTVAPDWYVLQPGHAEARIMYGFAHRVGDEIRVYDPQECPDALLDVEGITVEDDEDCLIETTAGLVEAARRMVEHPDRDRILGEVTVTLLLSSHEEPDD